MRKWWKTGLLAGCLAGGLTLASAADKSDADLYRDAAARLDKDAAIYGYMSLRPLGRSLGGLLDAGQKTAEQVAENDANQKAQVDLVAKIVRASIRQLGLDDLTSTGFSTDFRPAGDNAGMALGRFFVESASGKGAWGVIFGGPLFSGKQMLADLPDNVMLAARGQFKPGAFLQKLLDDPDLSLLRNQLANVPFPLNDILDALNGEWKLTASAEADNALGLMLDAPDKKNTAFNLICALSAAADKIKLDGDTITIDVAGEGPLTKLFLRKGAERILLLSDLELPARLAAAKPGKTLADAAEAKQLLATMPERCQAAFFVSRQLGEFFKAFLPEEAGAKFEPAGVMLMTAPDGTFLTSQELPYAPPAAAPEAAKAIRAELEAEGTSYFCAQMPPLMATWRFALDKAKEAGDEMDEDALAFIEKFPRISKAVGLDGLAAVGMSSRATGTDAAPLYRVRLAANNQDGALDGALWQFATGAAKPVADFAQRFPQGALAAYAGNWDLAAALKALSPALPEDGLKDFQEKFKDTFGIALEEALAAASGECAAVVVAAPEADDKDLPFAFAARVADKDGALFKALSQAAGKSPEWKVEGDTLARNADNGEALENLVFKKGDGALIIVSSPKALAAAAPVAGKTLAEDEHYRKLSAGLPERANGFAYVSPLLWKNLHELAGYSVPQQAKRLIDQALLDPKSALPVAFCAVGVRRAQGETWTANSTVEPSAAILSPAVLAIPAGMAASGPLMRARNRARRNAR